MRYFIIAGEASGDLHGAQLIAALKARDSQADFRFLGGDEMAAQAGRAPIIHFRDMAFMGFIEVLKHLRQIMGFMAAAKQAMAQWRPDALVLIDYPSFNLKVAKWAHGQGIPCYYFISPKVWVWKEWRVRDIKRWVRNVYCILPFEPDFYQRRHQYSAEYVGNPTVAEIAQARSGFMPLDHFVAAHHLQPGKPIIALVPGSRRKEIRDNLPTMVQAARRHPDCQAVIAGAPGIDASLYQAALGGEQLPVVMGHTMELVSHAQVALVTSGTATLEAAVIGTPQVAVYRMNGSKLVYSFYRRLLKGDYVTLPNLITGEPVIPELLLHHCTADAVDAHLAALLPAASPQRQAMLAGYGRMSLLLTTQDCAATVAERLITDLERQ